MRKKTKAVIPIKVGARGETATRQHNHTTQRIEKWQELTSNNTGFDLPKLTDEQVLRTYLSVRKTLSLKWVRDVLGLDISKETFQQILTDVAEA